MCFGGGRTPEVKQAPAPSPAPSVVPSQTSPQATGDARRKRLEQLRSGIVSTIKTGPKGITGAGPELQAPTLLGKALG